jgi:FAD/FMN-containing dehydrogenase
MRRASHLEITVSTLFQRTIDELSRRLTGRIYLPDSEGYAAATQTWAKPPDGVRPRAAIHCRSAEDVRAAIHAARENELPLSVRGGGHDWAGRALCDGIVIDLGGMRAVKAAGAGRIEIAGGALASDVADIADPLSGVVAAGSAGCVGMTGLTLGGGYGPLIGRCGLALDNLLSAEVVLADGRIVTAHADDNTDLFWALRGGGGNFGVVTAMEHRLHEIATVATGVLVYPFAEAAAVLAGVTELAAAAPDELSVQIVLVADPAGTIMVLVIPTWCGDPAQDETRLAPFGRLGTLLAGRTERQSHGAALTAFDSQIINGRRTYMETCWLPALDQGSIEALIAAMECAVSPGCALVTHEFKGAASRVAADATAFGLRRDHVLIEMIAAFDDRGDPAEDLRHRNWARRARDMFVTALPGGYPNLLGPDDPKRAADSYGRNATRLRSIKSLYDPDNVFASAIPLPPRSEL